MSASRSYDSQQLELFRARAGDIAARDAQDLMSWPFFSLAKVRRVTPIDFRMVLQNGTSEQTLTFRSGQSFDLTIRTDTGAQVWRWSNGRVFTQALRTLALRPGEEQVFAARWDQRSDAGAPVGPGVYQAAATLTSTEGVLSNTITFLIH